MSYLFNKNYSIVKINIIRLTLTVRTFLMYRDQHTEQEAEKSLRLRVNVRHNRKVICAIGESF